MFRVVILMLAISLISYSCKKGSITPIEPKVNTLVRMVLVEGGSFTMGDTWGDGEGDEIPTHLVTLSSFYISRCEITQAQYRDVMDSNPSYFSGDNLPVEQVEWHDAVAFCNALSQREGLTPSYMIDSINTTCDFSANGYRLPTESEWEYAARGGNQSEGYKYSGSNMVEEVAWCYTNSDSQTHYIGTKLANELGIYDMTGNVWEWCWDWKSTYSSKAQVNPTGPDSGRYRIFRGGGWAPPPDVLYQRVANRGAFAPVEEYKHRGFRIARAKNQ